MSLICTSVLPCRPCGKFAMASGRRTNSSQCGSTSNVYSTTPAPETATPAQARRKRRREIMRRSDRLRQRPDDEDRVAERIDDVEGPAAPGFVLRRPPDLDPATPLVVVAVRALDEQRHARLTAV